MFEDDNNIYLVLEYCSKGDMLTKLQYNGGYADYDALRIFTEIAEAVQHLHSRGIYHRDIKPENILIDCHGHIKICDFGLAVVCR